jgi:hypothetical protein
MCACMGDWGILPVNDEARMGFLSNSGGAAQSSLSTRPIHRRLSRKHQACYNQKRVRVCHTSPRKESPLQSDSGAKYLQVAPGPMRFVSPL